MQIKRKMMIKCGFDFKNAPIVGNRLGNNAFNNVMIQTTAEINRLIMASFILYSSNLFYGYRHYSREVSIF